MEKKVQNINGEDQYKNVINLLKELPKVKAPNNFELNLMTRIHNKNFEIGREKSSEFTIWRFLKPAAAVSLTAVLIFFVIDLNSIDLPNPLLTDPELRKNVVNDSETMPLQNEFIVEETTQPETERKDEAPKAIAGKPGVNNRGYKVVISENDVISKEILEFSADSKSVDVDARLKMNSAQGPQRAFLAGGAGAKRQRMVFDGFHTRSLENKWLQDSLSKYSDSVQNVEEKSVKK